MMNNQNKICVLSDFSELEKIRTFILSSATYFGFNKKISFQIALAVDEACTNIINYAHKKENNKEICIEIDHSTNEFIVKIFDEGSPFDPNKANTPNLSEHLQKMKRGGLGIHIIKNVIDNINYYPHVINNKNLLELRKKLA